MGQSQSESKQHRPKQEGPSQPQWCRVTTPKSQVMAVLCAHVVAKRPATASGHEVTCAVRSGPAPSLVQWTQTTALVRMWAEEWVLSTCQDAVFRLPIRDTFLRVVVSPTMGVLSHSWFTHATTSVCGGLGRDSLLVRTHTTHKWATEYSVMDLGVPASRRRGARAGESFLGNPRLMFSRAQLRCNRKWIVGLMESCDVLCMWKVVGGGPVEPERSIHGIEASNYLQFSPQCLDVVMIISAHGKHCVIFVDLEATFNVKELVVTSKVPFYGNSPGGFLWMPDGSLCALQYCTPSVHLLDANGKTIKVFPPNSQAVPFDRTHVFVCSFSYPTEFQVYRTGNNLTEPSLCMPCTWACLSRGNQTSLIASTSHQYVKGGNMHEMQFTVHDGVTGCHVGDFSVTVTPPFFFDSSVYLF
ncbi:hypothetical protein Pelo_10207 [Pelomyxa schiedti]|nr:hypothetical protein Pelo_10207 [Pelomyxa schiedti]